jgi:hypothetical protein
MTDEADISRERRWFYEQSARTVISNPQKRNMAGIRGNGPGERADQCGTGR